MHPFKHRLTRCPACDDTFSYRYNVTPEPGDQLIIRATCPFCKVKLKIDLNPYTRRTMVSYKGDEDHPDGESGIIELELPAELPGTVEE